MLATDYDGTLAASGRVDDRTAAAVERLHASGRRLVLVTGRIRADLEVVFPRVHLFDSSWRRTGGRCGRPTATSVSSPTHRPSPSSTCCARAACRSTWGDRPRFLARLWPRIQEMRARTGRPHWLVLDEAHRVLPRGLDAVPAATASLLGGLLLATSHPELVSDAVLPAVNVAIETGEDAPAMLGAVASALRVEPPRSVPPPRDGEILLWRLGEAVTAVRPSASPPVTR